MATLEEWARQQIKQGSLPTTSDSDSSLEKWATEQLKKSTVTPTVSKPMQVSPREPEEKKKTTWQWIVKQLEKGVAATSGEMEALGEAIATLATGIKGPEPYIPGKRAYEAITGKREGTWQDFWMEHGIGVGLPPTVARTIGLTWDLVYDPLNFTAIGPLTKVGKLASKATAVTKAGKTIKAGSKMAKQISKYGLKAEDLVLAGTKAEQAARGQRALLSFMGRPVIKGAPVFRGASKALEIAKATKAGSILGGGLATAFRTTTKASNKALAEMVIRSRNLEQFRTVKTMNKAVKFQKSFEKLIKNETDLRLFANAVESESVRKTVTNPEIRNLANQLDELYDVMLGKEQKLGILPKKIKDYAFRLRKSESFLKEMFSPKKYQKVHGPSFGREILSLQDEAGNIVRGDYKAMGFKQLNPAVIRDALEKKAMQKTKSLQDLAEALSRKEIETRTADLKTIISDLRKQIPQKRTVGTVKELAEPTAKELDNIYTSIINPLRDEMKLVIDDLERLVRSSGGEEFLKLPLNLEVTRNARLKWAFDEMRRTQNTLADKLRKVENFNFVDRNGKMWQRISDLTTEINDWYGKEFFEKNPVVAWTARGLASAKATTAREFINEAAEKFFVAIDEAPKGFVKSENPLLKGLAAEPEVVKVVDQYLKGIQPDELKLIIRTIDGAQNWWKAQVLISPSYHLRNMVGNFWNNWLAGVANPAHYHRGRKLQRLASLERLEKDSAKIKKLADEVLFTTDYGEVVTVGKALKEAQQQAMMGTGWYGKDIGLALQDEIGGIWQQARKIQGWMPWRQDNVLFKTNRVVGTAIEDNAKLANYLFQRQKGWTPLEAGRLAKKYLFDYCFDEKTEILTSDGFKKWYEIEAGYKALTLNMKKDQLEWSDIEGLNIQNYQGFMNHWHSTRFDAMMTDNHKLITKKYVSGQLNLEKVKDLQKTPILKVSSDNYLAPKKKMYSDTFVELVGWVLTEGNYSHQGKSIQIYQSAVNPDTLKQLRNCHTKIQKEYPTSSYNEYTFRRKKNIHSFYIGLDLSKKIIALFPDKQLHTEFLLQLTNEQLKLLYDVMIAGDGTVNKKSGMESFSQKGEEFSKAFQVLCFLLGYRSNSRLVERNGKFYHVISVYKSKDVHGAGLQKKKVPYNGKIWCITTKNKTLVARRNGTVYLSGNSDLTWTEKNIFKRIAPFYFWTSRNIPLQLENVLIYPGKFAALPKIIKNIEDRTPDPKTEKYLSDYVTENIPVKYRINKEGHHEYFLIGNWLPAAQAVDFLSQPFENIINMVSPLAKTPIEWWANKSWYFKNTLGESSKLEYYYKDPTEFPVFPGTPPVPMRKKTAHVMRNIRILNDWNKWAKEGTKDTPEDSAMVKLLNIILGKAATYDIRKSRYFYDRDTQAHINELENAIKKARKLGNEEHAYKLKEELQEFKKAR